LFSEEFYKVQLLKPYISHTYVLKNHEHLVGFYIATTQEQMEDIEHKTPNWYRDDPLLANNIEAIYEFYSEKTAGKTFILHKIAIHLKTHHEQLVKAQQCSRILFGVWKTNPAINVFQHCGAVRRRN